ncbi:hypothetical protein L226DRAFT_227388 [Lentinus tigrinus ALCF2SS1-7]|uniref:Uncharacterized protein n=1 Tax=Lentinus tigrinus ALCF2SS1-6 TaxID=1328759 RepID=A0A5C2S9C0_9APHY|nr:hypothetical protein L227DRAFT_201228 [Lentinus tigrinus ALCF2SS1-6]RPD70408.1 hypothetical protein L226DRAFT_227388 [Lentinus tigrinus ALCF2SS1-7]
MVCPMRCSEHASVSARRWEGAKLRDNAQRPASLPLPLPYCPSHSRRTHYNVAMLYAACEYIALSKAGYLYWYRTGAVPLHPSSFIDILHHSRARRVARSASSRTLPFTFITHGAGPKTAQRPTRLRPARWLWLELSSSVCSAPAAGRACHAWAHDTLVGSASGTGACRVLGARPMLLTYRAGFCCFLLSMSSSLHCACAASQPGAAAR